MPINVLYINHYGVLSGAARSLIELIKNFPGKSVNSSFVTPKGKIENIVRSSGLECITVYGISKFDHTRVGYYRGARWLILIREIIYFFPTLFFFLYYKKHFAETEIIHLNENTCLVPLLFSKIIWKKKTVLHCRAVMNSDKKLFRTRVIGKLFRKYADVLIAIDETVKSSLPYHSCIYVVHNGLSIGKSSFVTDSLLQQKMDIIGRRKLNLGFVGTLDKNKGIYELCEAVKFCVDEGMDINLFLLGSTLKTGKGLFSHFWNSIKKKHTDTLDEHIKALKLTQHVHRLGFSVDVKTFYSFIDVICFPTYYYAPGRPVIEGALFNKPSILCVEGSWPDTFIEDVTGRKVDVKNVRSIVSAIREYYDNPFTIYQHGANANILALENFDIIKNAEKMIAVYEGILKTGTKENFAVTQ